jgi:hypothetical protein
MNLAAVRTELESAILLGGISKVYKYVPARPNPLCAIMEPDTEFITFLILLSLQFGNTPQKQH